MAMPFGYLCPCCFYVVAIYTLPYSKCIRLCVQVSLLLTSVRIELTYLFWISRKLDVFLKISQTYSLRDLPK